MTDRHTSIVGSKIKSDGDGISITKGSASIIGNVITSKGSGIVIGEEPPIPPTLTTSNVENKWLEKPFWFIVSTIFCGLVVAFCAYYFGWTH